MKGGIFLCFVVLLLISGCKTSSIIGSFANAPEEIASLKNSNCKDSDGGNVPGVIGTVSGTDENGAFEETDECIDGFLVEYYCKKGEKASMEIGCNCLNGACT